MIPVKSFSEFFNEISPNAYFVENRKLFSSKGEQIYVSQGEQSVVTVCSGYSHTAVITSNKSLHTFGSGYDGQLGHGDTENLERPMRVRALENVISVSCGAWHTGVITSDYELYMFGRNKWGQLGTGDKVNRVLPAKIGLIVQKVSCGFFHTGVITVDGCLYICGDGEVEFIKVETGGKVDDVHCGFKYTHVFMEGKVYTIKDGLILSSLKEVGMDIYTN